eukprot:4363126-Alexandrium_andersonii.AAC.1
MSASLVGSEMCIRDRRNERPGSSARLRTARRRGRRSSGLPKSTPPWMSASMPAVGDCSNSWGGATRR